MRTQMLAGLGFFLLACGGGGGGGVDDATVPDAGVDTSLPPVDIPNPVLVQTMAPEEVRVGDMIPITCLIIDENGEAFSAVGRTPRFRVAPESSIERRDGAIIAIRAGQVEVSCEFADLMLTDESPAIVRIVPGDPAEVITTVDRSQIEAGESISVTCDVFDAFGNRIDDAAPTMGVEPEADGNTTTDLTTEFTAAGNYEVSCELPGAVSTAERVEVTPTLPASLVIARVPDQPVYAIGQVVEVVAVVSDRYDNTIPDADVGFVSAPRGSTLGRNRFRYDADGTYTVTATVVPPTEGDIPLTADTQIVVNGNGPQIQCTGPRDGAMIDVGPGSRITFSGEVDDTSGIMGVTVNGAPASLDGSGNFSAPITTRFGVNFVDIVATDSFGTENSQTCAFLASNRYASPTGILGDTISLKLGMPAIDDGSRSGPINSLNDLLHTVVNSSGLRDTLHGALSANPVIKPNSCDVSTFLGCAVRSEVRYLNSELNGPNDTALRLVNGGLAATVNLRNTRVQLRASGRAIGIPFNTTGWVTFSSITVNLTFNVALVAGRPRVSVRPGSISVSVGSINTSFGGLDGAVINVIADLANGLLRNLVADLVSDYIEDSFDEVLDGLLGGLDISSLGSTISVPTLDGETLNLGFGVGFSSVSTTTSRFLVGIGSRFTGPTNVAFPTLGVAIPPGTAPNPPLLDDPALSGQSMGVSIQAGVFNQVMHTLWRAGLLNATVTGDDLGGDLPEGVSANIVGRLPPVAEINGESVEVGIGSLDLDLVYPGLFDEPLRVTLGARASTDVSLSGNDLSFSAITIEELFFSTGDVTLDASTRNVLERFLRTLVQSIVDNVLNDSLPALPIPSFTLPASLTSFGLPAGTELGIRSPSLRNESQHFVLRGNFGEI
ncbi:MAG: hypothetical protein AAGE52_24790 [Myxococcota bacterium]